MKNKKKSVWKIKFHDKAFEDLKALDKEIQKKILKYLHTRIAVLEDPTVFAKPLSHNKRGLWRYRMQEYRIVCEIDKGSILILVVRIGHRKDVYEK